MQNVPRLSTITDKCTIQQGGNSVRYICYKGVPLFETLAASLDNYDIFVSDLYLGDPYVLYCKDALDDWFVYTMWENKDAALAWLENPKK